MFVSFEDLTMDTMNPTVIGDGYFSKGNELIIRYEMSNYFFSTGMAYGSNYRTP